MNTSNNIITGERIQEIADVYIGTEQNFQYNPRISIQYNKQKKLSDFTDNMPYDNPRIVFCYGDSISQFNNIKHLLKNPFVFISHNSDLNMTDNSLVNEILNCPNLIRWHSQNVDYKHEKLLLISLLIHLDKQIGKSEVNVIIHCVKKSNFYKQCLHSKIYTD